VGRGVIKRENSSRGSYSCKGSYKDCGGYKEKYKRG